MKLTAALVLVLSSLASPTCGAIGIRGLVDRVKPNAVDAPAEEGVGGATVHVPDQEGRRQLQRPGCWGNSGTTPQAWHPTYSAGWMNGFCRFTQDCNTFAYPTQLACCNGAYPGQASGFCVSRLPNPPTLSPTQKGGLDEYYPDYNRPWPEGQCINTRPLPSGRPTYSTMLSCCKGAYAGQTSGNCLMQLPSPPTGAPTNSAYEAEFFYPQYELPWSEAGCSNQLPLPYNNVNDRPNYPTMIACCKGAYGGQMSGACLARLPNPPTTSPTSAGGADLFYPDYTADWSVATCINRHPVPSDGSRPTFASKELCCASVYGDQWSRACVCSLENPPPGCSTPKPSTRSPTPSPTIAPTPYECSASGSYTTIDFEDDQTPFGEQYLQTPQYGLDWTNFLAVSDYNVTGCAVDDYRYINTGTNIRGIQQDFPTDPNTISSRSPALFSVGGFKAYGRGFENTTLSIESYDSSDDMIESRQINLGNPSEGFQSINLQGGGFDCISKLVLTTSNGTLFCHPGDDVDDCKDCFFYNFFTGATDHSVVFDDFLIEHHINPLIGM